MKCPKCNAQLKKARLDVYWCEGCRCAWLIHRLSTYKTFEEAGERVDKEAVAKTFLKPLMDAELIMVPPK